MPTKERLEAEDIKMKENQSLEPIPPNVKKYIELGLFKIEKLGYDDRYSSGKIIKFDEKGNPYISKNWGKSGSKEAAKERILERKDYANELKRKYPNLWGQRGKAGTIARLSGRNIRTIQKYFKDFC